jgi:CO/xanthine dehydrogenase FAD-binding subunit
VIPVLDGYELVTPESLDAALEDLGAHPDARPFAGGTDLMVVLEAGRLPAGRYVDLSQCREIDGVRETTGGVSIGAMTTYTTIRDSAILARDYPMLRIAASETGGVATQNRGTIGGNIANGSPAADTPPVLLAYDAELELLSTAGSRRVPYVGFHRGYKKMDLRPGEIIGRVHLSRRSPGECGRDHYRKVGTRRAQAISKVCFAGTIAIDGGVVRDVRLALGSVAPTVVRARRTEAALRGRTLDAEAIADAGRTLASEIAPIDDIRSTARYRARVAENLLEEFLRRT